MSNRLLRRALYLLLGVGALLLLAGCLPPPPEPAPASGGGGGGFAPPVVFVPAPSITALAAAAGPEAGGNVVVITGTAFPGATAVDFGATAATSFTVDSATQITATAPAGAGTVRVSVTTPFGTSADTAADDYRYAPTPTVTSVSPSSGPVGGGSAVTITGTAFTGATGVQFGGNAATGVTVNSSTQITVTAPAGTGTVDVLVATPGGVSANAVTDDYEYVPAPTVTSVSPTSGLAAGGATVTITGTNFTGATAVQFGSTPAVSYTVDNDTQITAVSPSGSGSVGVTITTVGGSSANTSADDFAFIPVPVVTGLTPAAGPEFGFTALTISGSGFTGATSVDFGAVAAITFTVDNDTQITATTPGGIGAVDVRVTTPGGTSANTAADDYGYAPTPMVTGLSPASGPFMGGNTVTITGTGFTGATSVQFGFSAAPTFTVDSAAQITAVAPSGFMPGFGVNVTVTTPGGTSFGPATYTHLAAPFIMSVSPATGPEAGGGFVGIMGTGFTGATSVEFGSTPASFTVINDGSISVTVPAGIGTVNVRVTTPGGDSGSGFFSGYRYVGMPAITGVSPASGPELGGTAVVITGTGFTGVTAVHFGATAATGVSPFGDDLIFVTAPAGTGTVDVQVTTGVGTSANTAADDYQYLPPAPDIVWQSGGGPLAGGNTVYIQGSNFTGASAVTFGSTPATSFTVDSDTEITAIAPSGIGTVDVIVIGPGGASANAGADDYTYEDPPTITSLDHATGPGAPWYDDIVIISGTGFTNAYPVLFGSDDASFTVDSSTQITAYSPGGSGTVDVSVSNFGGTSPNTTADDYTFIAPPVVTSLSPAVGVVAGGDEVAITGTGFTNATDVFFFENNTGVNPVTFIIDSDTEIRATSPASPFAGPGAVEVWVVADGGVSERGGASPYTFEYLDIPCVCTLSPSTGSEDGGTTVVITGYGFASATAVDFGATPATSFVVDDDTQITATAPAGTGTVDVTVTNPLGTSDPGGSGDDFTYWPSPTVTGLSPSSGPAVDGVTVVITGAHFTGATHVSFAGYTPASFTVDNDTQITAVTPQPVGPGEVSVIVTTPAGPSADTDDDNYTNLELLYVTQLIPPSGHEHGGNTVTIIGSYLTGVTGVEFGPGNFSSSFTVIDDDTITAVVPPGTGAVQVRVTRPLASSFDATVYTYWAIPTVAGLSPSAGPEAGGTDVVITGTHLADATDVTFGGTTVAFTVDSDTQITATSPAGTGTVDVAVTNALGTSDDTAADDFRYAPLPAVDGMTPGSGVEAGGESVTITGSGFTDATDVTFGGSSASFTVDSDTQITATSPMGTGTVDVSVTAPGGTSDNTAADDYRYLYVGPPDVSFLNPSSGPEAGTCCISIHGRGFVNVTDVTFGGVSTPYFEVDNDGLVIAELPPGTGTVDVRVVADLGTSANTAADDFTYDYVAPALPPPSIDFLTPSTGGEPGGDEVTITGSGFNGATDVTFDGVSVGFTVDGDSQIRVTTPAGTGTVDVVVITASGTSGSTPYTYFT